MASPVMQLKCDCNNYPWGKPGTESMAARLCAQTPNTDFKIDSSKEYAEMWMGTYPTTPSYVLKTGELLQDVINANKAALFGPKVLEKFGADLPFLPKILSIAKALPLQIHPNKSLASKLHSENPDQFSDPNHKPEIAVALGPFEVFAGFKQLSEIEGLLTLEPLQRFFPSSGKLDAEGLRGVCKRMLKADEAAVKDAIGGLTRLGKGEFGNHTEIPELLPRLTEQYGSVDNGILVALVCMNFLKLDEGDAVYVPADGIHAYLSGDIVECMARSDNVLNTGFCPRGDRDSIELFSNALTFKSVSKDDMLLPSEGSEKSVKGKTKVYRPALSEFDMLVTKLSKGESEEVKGVNGPSVMIVTSGNGTMSAGSEKYEVKEGYIFFIGQGVDIAFESDTGLTAYRAYAE